MHLKTVSCSGIYPTLGETPIYYMIQSPTGSLHPVGTIGKTQCCGSLEIYSLQIDSVQQFIDLIKEAKVSVFHFIPWLSWENNRFHIFKEFNKKFEKVAIAHIYPDDNDSNLLVVIEILDIAAYMEMLK